MASITKLVNCCLSEGDVPGGYKKALLSVKNEVHLALARGEATAVILLDRPAMFDTIDHIMPIECLSSWFGVRGVVLHCHVVPL